MVRLRIPKHFSQEFSAIASLILLLIVQGIHAIYLPLLASNRVQTGHEYYSADRLDSALRAYRQALALQPNTLEAYYGLGLIYEDFQRTEEAIAAYQELIARSVASNRPGINKLVWLRAHNNLGRLYILQEDYQAAWILLKRAFDAITGEDLNNPDIQTEKYNLLKNLGWMWLRQKRFIEADEFLQQAIAQNSERAAAHCLQAQVLEGLQRAEEATPAWEQCIAGDRKSLPEEAEWAAMAREQLEQGEP
nr:tetratricopeptide repeat protein [Oculatella sp. FACHB-28]